MSKSDSNNNDQKSSSTEPKYWAKLVSTSLGNDLSKYNVPTSPIYLTKDVCNFNIGRDPSSNNLCINHPGVSSKHCMISLQKGTKGNIKVIITDFSTNGTYINKMKIGKGKEKEVTNDDQLSIIRLNDFRISFNVCVPMFDEEYADTNILTQYHIDKLLGEGAYAKVKRAVSKKDGELYALKMIDKAKINIRSSKPSDTSAFEKESEILYGLDHPAIIRVHDQWVNNRFIFILMELATGGDLLEFMLNRNKPFAEDEALDIFVQLAEAVHYLHERSIVHRDIKPENILVSQSLSDDDKKRLLLPLGTSGIRIKLTDFGLSRVVDAHDQMTTICGTPQYLAPEVLLMSPLSANLPSHLKKGVKNYSKAVDMWSLGAILFVLITFTQPFNDKDLVQNIVNGVYGFTTDQLSTLSKEVIDLVKKLLDVDSETRMSMETLLDHPWVRQEIEKRKFMRGEMRKSHEAGIKLDDEYFQNLIEKYENMVKDMPMPVPSVSANVNGEDVDKVYGEESSFMGSLTNQETMDGFSQSVRMQDGATSFQEHDFTNTPQEKRKRNDDDGIDSMKKAKYS